MIYHINKVLCVLTIVCWFYQDISAYAVTAKNSTNIVVTVSIITATATNTPEQGASLEFSLNPGETKIVSTAAGYCPSVTAILTDDKGTRYYAVMPVNPAHLKLYNTYCNDYSFIIKMNYKGELIGELM